MTHAITKQYFTHKLETHLNTNTGTHKLVTQNFRHTV